MKRTFSVWFEVETEDSEPPEWTMESIQRAITVGFAEIVLPTRAKVTWTIPQIVLVKTKT